MTFLSSQSFEFTFHCTNLFLYIKCQFSFGEANWDFYFFLLLQDCSECHWEESGRYPQTLWVNLVFQLSATLLALFILLGKHVFFLKALIKLCCRGECELLRPRQWTFGVWKIFLLVKSSKFWLQCILRNWKLFLPDSRDWKSS